MSGGYYRLHRSSWDDDDFAGDEFSRREAWFWLIGQAAWKPRQTTVGGQVINLERGQCAFSLRYLATAWGWSVKRVRTFIKAGTASAKIGHETGTRHTLITICNYDKYQSDAADEGTTGAQQGHKKGTNKKKERRKEGEDPPLVPPKGARRATALPDDWTIPDDFIEFAVGQGWTESEARNEADCFRDYWHGVGGQRGRKADWLATWRNWIRRANRPRSCAGRDTDPYLDAARDIIARDTQGRSAGGTGETGGLLAISENGPDRSGTGSLGNVIELQPGRGGGDVWGDDGSAEPVEGHAGTGEIAGGRVFAAAFRLPGGGG